MKKIFNRGSGFTLIEMLVVIAIIAILSSVFLVGLRGFRSSAYDARRLADLQKVQSYLEIYYTSKRAYPDVTQWGDSNCSSGSLCSELKTVAKVPGIPNDPISGQTYSYCVSNDKQGYILNAILSTSEHSSLGEPSEIESFDSSKFPGCGIDCTGPGFCIEF